MPRSAFTHDAAGARKSRHLYLETTKSKRRTNILHNTIAFLITYLWAATINSLNSG